MITDKEFCEQAHLLIHSVRLLQNYSPTNLEKRLSQIVLERFSDSCNECKNIKEKLKAIPSQQKQGILKKIGSAINNA